MPLRSTWICCVNVLSLLVATVAVAGPLPTDPAAIPAWQSSVVFSGPNGSNTSSVTATIEYAVYEPGQISTSAALGFPADVSAGADYVYAYEILTSAASLQEVVNFSVQIQAGAVPGTSTNRGHYPATPELGLGPVLSQFLKSAGVVTNAKWTFGSPWVTPGNHSDILWFTSPFGPQYLPASLTGDASTLAVGYVPSPIIPEPSTLALSALAIICLFAARRFPKQTARR